MEHQVDGSRIRLRSEQGTVEIKLSAEGIRQIASLRLPRTEVEIELAGFSDTEAAKFISRFDLAYQKGGG